MITSSRTAWFGSPRRALCAVTASVVFVVAGQVAGAAPKVTPGQIANLQHERRVAAEQLAALLQRSERLSNRYDTAIGAAQELKKSINATTTKVKVLTLEVAADKSKLIEDAVNAYVLGEADNGPTTAFSGNSLSTEVRRTYEIAAAGDLAAESAAYSASKNQLTTNLATLTTERTAALANAAAIKDLAVQNAQAEAATNAIYAKVSARLRTALAVQAEQIAEARAAAAAKAASGGSTGSSGGGSSGGYTSVGGSSTPSGQGGDALHAAQSQLGVPYVWGGETPGQGFDCSGLTQWAWAQAGISIPRVAAAQWQALPHVSVQKLEPGDLLFYYNLDGDFQVDHVVMYAGMVNGVPTVIQAPHTGATVSYSPVWFFGLIGAARP